ncbi:MAG: hypothetical protein E7348_00320 [Clostridiales bacterium]|nr:hypothetical protein [Clostridiales bacterium]
MKKFKLSIALITLSLFILATFSGCEKPIDLSEYLTELKYQSYANQDCEYVIKANYGFIEDNHVTDGKVGKKTNLLTFKLLDRQTDNVTYTVSLDFNGVNYKSNFKLSPVSHSLVAVIEINDFNLNEFEITLSHSSENVKTTLTSILPENTITYKQALTHLQTQQSQLIASYIDQDGRFNGEIAARILVKDEHPYWYIGLCDKDGNLKALLIDGFNGEILAIRQIF